MAKRSKKTLEVKSFGGVDDLGSVREENNFTPFTSGMSGEKHVESNVNWDAKSLETQSDTHLEDDDGYGQAIILRNFTFKIDPSELTRHVLTTGGYPGKQDLFNSVYKFIETALWTDGLKVFPDQDPRVIIDENYTKFDIFVASIPQKGQRLLETPQTLSQLVHGR